MLTAWRLYKPAHAATAFSGDGARIYGGRWNSKGTAVVYVSERLTLASLELLVHLNSAQVLETYEFRPVSFEDSLVENLDPNVLPPGWRADPAPPQLRMIGDQWVRQGRSVVLRVPTALVPGEFNYLINPTHPHAGRLQLGEAEEFRFDPRLG